MLAQPPQRGSNSQYGFKMYPNVRLTLDPYNGTPDSMHYYACTTKNDTIYYVQGDLESIKGQFVYRIANKKKLFTLYRNEIKSVTAGNRLFLTLPFSETKTGLQEIIVKSDKYVLTKYSETLGITFSIYDVDGKIIMYKVNFENRVRGSSMKEVYDASLLPYFGDCKEFSDVMHKYFNPISIGNPSDPEAFLYGVYNIQCTN
ncbi:MAG: hypothetical protein ABI772_11280 [Bacteroidota bacterium]